MRQENFQWTVRYKALGPMRQFWLESLENLRPNSPCRSCGHELDIAGRTCKNKGKSLGNIKFSISRERGVKGSGDENM